MNIVTGHWKNARVNIVLVVCEFSLISMDPFPANLMASNAFDDEGFYYCTEFVV